MSKYWIFKCLAILFLLSFVSCKKDKAEAPELTPVVIAYGSMTDQEGNSYKTVKIGTQTWMAENLRSLTYRNGDPIPLVTDNQKWGEATTGAYCNYNNTPDVEFTKTYGRLYNQLAVNDSRNLAPLGWHVPSIDEWELLINFLGENEAGKRMIEKGNSHWIVNPYASNNSSFTGLPSGERLGFAGAFIGLGTVGNCWSSNENIGCAWYYDEHTTNYYTITRTQFALYYNYGLSVRLVKNNN